MDGSPMKDRINGFTLIEILVVLTIIGLLIAVSGGAYVKYISYSEGVKTRAMILELEGYARDYNDRRGDYPPSLLQSLGLTSRGDEANEGIESFVQAIYAKKYYGNRPDSTSNLINSDEDEADKNITEFAHPELLEFEDAWGNPLIYIRHTDYEREFTYLFQGPTGWEYGEVQALKNPRTGTYYNFESCQIISVGPDALFDTDDDVANFDRVFEDDE